VCRSRYRVVYSFSHYVLSFASALCPPRVVRVCYRQRLSLCLVIPTPSPPPAADPPAAAPPLRPPPPSPSPSCAPAPQPLSACFSCFPSILTTGRQFGPPSATTMLAAGTVTTGSASRSGAPAVCHARAPRGAPRAACGTRRASRCRRRRALPVAALRRRHGALVSLSLHFSALDPKFSQTPPPPKKGMSIRCLQNLLGVAPKPWGPSKTLGSLHVGARAGAASKPDAAPARAWPAPGQSGDAVRQEKEKCSPGSHVMGRRP